MQVKPIENDSQPEELLEQLFQGNHPKTNLQTDVFILSSGENLYCRKVELLLQYHIRNKFMDPEGYAHHLLFIFLHILSKLKVG